MNRGLRRRSYGTPRIRTRIRTPIRTGRKRRRSGNLYEYALAASLLTSIYVLSVLAEHNLAEHNLAEHNLAEHKYKYNHNLSSPSRKLTSTISPEEAIANARGYTIDNENIKGDGSCMFRAISYQITGTQDYYKEYRKLGVDYIESILRNNETLTDNFDKSIQYEYKISYTKYLQSMRNDRWGDSYMLEALANRLNRKIIVIYLSKLSENRPELNTEIHENVFSPGKWFGENIPLSLRVNKTPEPDIAIGYINQNHYLSLSPLKKPKKT